MVFPSSTIPIVINPLAFGNMVHRNVWNHTAQVLQEINRITNSIHDNLTSSGARYTATGSNCASSASACATSGPSVSTSSSSSPAVSSINGDTFEVKIQVEHFKPEEINVKLIDSNSLIVEGKHEERSDDHGFISRSFSRRFTIPEIYDTDKMESQLSLNKVLTIKAPRKVIQGTNGEKIIPITLTSTISSVDETMKSTPETVPPIKSTTSTDGNNQTINNDGSNQDEPEASK